MKKIILLIFIDCLFVISKSQTISPLTTNEYCPNTEYTFTASLPKPYSSMVTEGGCQITQNFNAPGVFSITFKAKFLDANQKQTFVVYYSDNTYNRFEFLKVKSLLFNSTNCAYIQPNLSVINAPRCQQSSFSISFSNIQWGTAFETSPFCFGSITNYEYQLPVGWKIGTSFTSTGSNWYAGKNSVAVTSDLINGDGGSVKIRPINTGCGSGLNAGAIKAITISRPEPALNITGSQNYLCAGTNSTFTINKVPAGATVAWSVSNTSLAQITSGSTSNTVTLYSSGGNGVVTLAAAVRDCNWTYNRNYTVYIGAGNPPDNISTIYDHNCGTVLEAYCGYSNPNTTGFYWTITDANKSATTNYRTSTSSGGGVLILQPFLTNAVQGNSTTYYVTVQGITNCGTSASNSTTAVVNIGPVGGDCGSPNLNDIKQRLQTLDVGNNIKNVQVFPNPATNNNIIITIPKDSIDLPHTIINITDAFGKTVKTITIVSERNSVPVSSWASGSYFINITDGRKRFIKRIIKQ